jgi:hypothetical protein
MTPGKGIRWIRVGAHSPKILHRIAPDSYGMVTRGVRDPVIVTVFEVMIGTEPSRWVLHPDGYQIRADE